MKLKKGDKVKLLRPIIGRYSGYGGRPQFTAEVGAIATIKSGPHPGVTRNALFYNADVPGWGEGIGFFPCDGEVTRA